MHTFWYMFLVVKSKTIKDTSRVGDAFWTDDWQRIPLAGCGEPPKTKGFNMFQDCFGIPHQPTGRYVFFWSSLQWWVSNYETKELKKLRSGGFKAVWFKVVNFFSVFILHFHSVLQVIHGQGGAYLHSADLSGCSVRARYTYHTKKSPIGWKNNSEFNRKWSTMQKDGHQSSSPKSFQQSKHPWILWISSCFLDHKTRRFSLTSVLLRWSLLPFFGQLSPPGISGAPGGTSWSPPVQWAMATWRCPKRRLASLGNSNVFF